MNRKPNTRKVLFSLVGIATLLFMAGLGLRYVAYLNSPIIPPTAITTPQTPPKPPQAPKPPNVPELLALVNNERVKAGEAPLVEDARLDASATAKCADMVRLDEWDHNLSDGTTPYTFIQAQYRRYKAAGENLAYSYNDSPSTVAAWMASPGHRANILDTRFNEVGYAVCSAKDFPNIVVQHFVSE